MEKYCKFLQDVKDQDAIIWIKDFDYLVTYEDSELYCFGESMVNGISKEYENKLFKVIKKN